MLDNYTLEAKKNHRNQWSMRFYQPGNTSLPVDFTSVTSIRFRARYGYDTANEITCGIGDGITVLGFAVNGAIQLEISATKTASIPNVETTLVYDIDYLDASTSAPIMLLTGYLKIYPSVF